MTEFEEADAAGDMDPGSAAEFALGDGDDPGGSAFGSGGGPMGRLFDGNARGPGVGEIEADYGFSKHWAVFARGCIRAGPGDGVPPIVEIVMGAVLAAVYTFRSSEGEGEWGEPADDSELGPA